MIISTPIVLGSAPTMGALRRAHSVYVGLLILKAVELGYEIQLEDGQCRDGHMPNSLHYVGLAQDASLFKDGVYLDKSEDYKPLGDYWESLDPEHNRWGGNFHDENGNPKPDGDHFSTICPNLTGNRA